MKENKEILANNCYLRTKNENGYINLSLDIGNIKGVKVRLIVPNRKLSYKIHCAVNGIKE